jgi:hypothetical protein
MESESLHEGVNLMPAALRAAGLDPALRTAGIAVADLGDLDIEIADHVRDRPRASSPTARSAPPRRRSARRSSTSTPPTSLSSSALLVASSWASRRAARAVPSRRPRLRRRPPDYYDTESAPVGALADMELGVLMDTALVLTAIVGEPPLVYDGRVGAGFRDL